MANNNNCNSTKKSTGTITSFIRNHYFYGKLLTVSDFKLEQDYFIDKFRLNNQLLQGMGIIDGLEVTKNKDKFTLSAGYAIDGNGNMIVVNSERKIDIDIKNDATDKKNFYLCIEYDESQRDSVPVANGNTQCEEEGCCYNRVEERYKITIKDSASPCTSDNQTDIVLAVVKNGNIDTETKKYRCMIKSNQEIQDILCRHLEAENPHNIVTTSINGLTNDVTIEKKNAITITSSGQNITIGENHSAKTNNPHHTKHSDIEEVKGFGTSSDTTKDKHISNNDAKKWNSYNINGVKPNNSGRISLKAGENISIDTISTRGRQQSIIISATNTNSNQSYYLEQDIVFPNNNNDFMREFPISPIDDRLLPSNGNPTTHIIKHDFGRFPVVDVYLLVKEETEKETEESYIKHVISPSIQDGVSIFVRQIDINSVSITATRKGEPFDITLKVILMA